MRGPGDPGEEEMLAAIAKRCSDPALAYATDEDVGYLATGDGIDPEANQFDLGDNPLALHRKRLALSRELWDRTQVRELKRGEDYSILRRNLGRGLSQASTAATNAAKYIGGVRVLRDHAGTGRLPIAPVPAAEQREALKLIASGLFSSESFRFRPEFLSSLAPDHLAQSASPPYGFFPEYTSPSVVPGCLNRVCYAAC